MRNIGMATAFGIILADVLLFVFYVVQYRQELGLSTNGSHDAPVARRKPAGTPRVLAGRPTGRGGVVRP
jgi:hypothetical protein